MSFGLGQGRHIDPAVGLVAIGTDELPPMPDEAATQPELARLDIRSWFNNPKLPLEIEIGSGKGTFLVQQAGREPDTNFLGIEWAKEFCAYAADRIRRRREADGTLTNVRMLHTDATEFLRWRVPDAIVRTVHLYFSDPWPKKRHHKNRVVQHRFLADVWRVLSPGGELRIVTDHDELWTWDREHFDLWTSQEGWARLAGFFPGHELSQQPVRPPYTEKPFTAPESAGEDELVGSNFERKFRVEGRSFHACTLVKNLDLKA